MEAPSERDGLFRWSMARGMAIRVIMLFCLMLLVVQPWKLPIEGLKAPFIIEVTRGVLGAPANEEETKENVDEKIQNPSSISVRPQNGIGELYLDSRTMHHPSPFFEVPTPPPQG